MKKLRLVRFPDRGLSTRTTDVSGVSGLEAIKPLIGPMLEKMEEESGVGLAANQVGVGKNFFVAAKDLFASQVLINPKAVWESKETQWSKEGCLSFPGLFIQVKRPKSMVVEYIDLDWNLRREVLEEYATTVFCHEVDHLNGIVFTDRETRRII